MPQPASTRWCPTPEQLMILEEMYKGGIRTPNASQIEQITAHLSFYGKIEGKNIFYWFQNHKARDRQKFRRRMSRQQQQQQQHLPSETSHFLVPHNHVTDFAVILHNPPQFHQEPTQGMSVGCKLESSEREEMAKRDVDGGQDWMMMEMGFSPCYNRPLKTLELFPMRSTGFKEETTSSSPFSS